MRAYAIDLRERMVQAVANGRPQREAARMFGVGVNTVKRSMLRQQQTGSLARRPIPGGPRRIGQEQEAVLPARLEAAPEAPLAEHGAWWAEQHGQSVSVATMWRALQRRGGTHKKKRWQPASGTRRRGRSGGPRGPATPCARWSSWMKVGRRRP
jgi:transposase